MYSVDTTLAAMTLQAYWSLDTDEILRRLSTTSAGLSSAEAARRLEKYGPNELRERRPVTRTIVLLNQVRSPLLLLLVFAAVAAGVAGEWPDALIVLVILAASVGIGYSREYSAQSAAARLQSRVRALAAVVRDGKQFTVPVRVVVPGDVILLSAGSLVPADAIVVRSERFLRQ